MATAKKPAAKKAAAKTSRRQEDRGKEGTGEEGSREEGSGEEGRSEAPGSQEDGCQEGSGEEGRSQEGAGEESGSEKGHGQEGRSRRRPAAKKKPAAKKAAKKPAAKKAAKKPAAKKAAAKACSESGARCHGRAGGTDHAEPAGCLAVSHGQQALRRRAVYRFKPGTERCRAFLFLPWSGVETCSMGLRVGQIDEPARPVRRATPPALCPWAPVEMRQEISAQKRCDTVTQ